MRGAGRAFMLCAMTGTGRRAWLPLAAAITANALHAAPARASAAEVALSVRNALTGEAVPARIQHGPPDQPMTPGKLDGTGRASLRVGPGRVDILATCEGFQPLATHVAPEAGYLQPTARRYAARRCWPPSSVSGPPRPTLVLRSAATIPSRKRASAP